MRGIRLILFLAVGLMALIGVDWLLRNRSHYLRLQHKSHEYYMELAAACDSVLALHPLGTNEVIWVSVTDPSLPRVIRDLHPLKLQVNPMRVWMLLDSDSRLGIGLTWQQKWDDTNIWKLAEIAESFETVLYSVKR